MSTVWHPLGRGDVFFCTYLQIKFSFDRHLCAGLFHPPRGKRVTYSCMVPGPGQRGAFCARTPLESPRANVRTRTVHGPGANGGRPWPPRKKTAARVVAMLSRGVRNLMPSAVRSRLAAVSRPWKRPVSKGRSADVHVRLKMGCIPSRPIWLIALSCRRRGNLKFRVSTKG